MQDEYEKLDMSDVTTECLNIDKIEIVKVGETYPYGTRHMEVTFEPDTSYGVEKVILSPTGFSKDDIVIPYDEACLTKVLEILNNG